MAQSKGDLSAKLTALGIAHDPNAKVSVLTALLPKAGAVAVSTTPVAQAPDGVAPQLVTPTLATAPTVEAALEGDDLDIQVGDPEELRPKELPLVITPGKGKKWKNDAQAEFAATLNGFAYANPEKWKARKARLLAQLREIGDNPAAIVKYRGNDEGKIVYKDKLHQSPNQDDSN